VAEAAVLRLFTFRADGNTSTVDSAIRRLAPALSELDGLEAFYAARRGHAGGEERVLVSVWASRDALRRAVDGQPGDELPGGQLPAGQLPAGEPPGDEPPEGVLPGEDAFASGQVEVYPIAVVEGEERYGDGPASILRLFRGRVRDGEMAAYIEDARVGARSDVAGGNGALGLYLSVCANDEFLTASAWTGWDRIQAATGGNVSNPIATRNTARLASGSVHHYEIVPNAIGGRVRRPSVVD
jgi:hypothetical protein